MNCYFMIKTLESYRFPLSMPKSFPKELQGSEESLLSHIKYIQNLNQTEHLMPVNGFCLS